MVVFRNIAGEWHVRLTSRTQQGPFASRERARVWQRGIEAGLTDEQLIEATGLGRVQPTANQFMPPIW